MTSRPSRSESAAPGAAATADDDGGGGRSAGARGWVGVLPIAAMLAVVGLVGQAMFPDARADALTLPESDDAVLLVLPAANRDAAALAAVRRSSADQLPVDTVLAQATGLLQRSRITGDPRQIGQAEALLAALPASLSPAQQRSATLMTATILQGRHQFDAAVRLLDRRLAEAANDADAWLQKATIAQARGRLDEALAACHRFAALQPGAVAAACRGDLASLRGDPLAYRHLQARLVLGAALDRPTLGWLELVLAGMAARTGDAAAAERHLRQSVEDHPDVQSIAALADWLVEAGRRQEARALLLAHGADDEAAPDPLLVRLAIACRDGCGAESSRHVARIRQRFAEIDRRGDTTHDRERALFALDVEGDPRAALAFARSNWTQQREPADARLLARCAHAANEPADLQALRDYLTAEGIRDSTIEAAMAGPAA